MTISNGMDGDLDDPGRLFEADSRSGVLCVCCRYGCLGGAPLGLAF